MFDRDTAPLCHALARAWTGFRALAVAAAAAWGVALTWFVPTAAARAPGACPGAHTPVPRASRAELRQAVVCLIDLQRVQRRLPPLLISQQLNRSAQGWTNVMVGHDAFGHGADFAARISAVGLKWSTAGENIATGYNTAAAVVRGWMASPAHCQNILSPMFTSVGTGISVGSIPAISRAVGTWTQDFALPAGMRAPSRNWGPAAGCPY